MNSKWKLLFLAILCAPAWGQVSGLYNAEVVQYTLSDDPAKAAQKIGDGWLAFSMPALEGTHSPCCWSGRWGKVGQPGCSLDSRHTSYGSSSESPLVDNVAVFARLAAGQVRELRVFGEQCPVDGDGEKVTWLANAGESDALDWLSGVGAPGHNNGALYALALHESAAATRRLADLAQGADRETASEAIFWLGEARGKQGFEALARLLDELPRGEARNAIAFGLAMNDSAEAAALLTNIARHDEDDELRGQALFWMAQEYPVEAEAQLLAIVRGEADEEVLDEAIFAISQLPGSSGGQLLLEIARDENMPRKARREALFWLAQSDDEQVVDELARLLTR